MQSADPYKSKVLLRLPLATIQQLDTKMKNLIFPKPPLLTRTEREAQQYIFESIYRRYVAACQEIGIEPEERISLDMTLSFSKETCPFGDQELLDSTEPNFRHDIFGMIRHMDRHTCKLNSCFVPLCSHGKIKPIPSIRSSRQI